MEGWLTLGYSLAAWIVIVVFALLPKKLPFTVNLCVYFCCIILLTSTFSILSLNLHWFVETDRLDYYFIRQLVRDLIYPFLMLIFINVFFTAKSAALRWGMALLIYAVVCFVHFAFILIGDLTFRHWNSFLSLLLCASYMVAACLFEKTFAYFCRKKEGVYRHDRL